MGSLPTARLPASRVSERASWSSDESCIIGGLAEARLDVVVDDGGEVWDQAPAVLIVKEAGGTFCDPTGERRFDLGWGIYSNGVLDAEVRALQGLENPSTT